MRFKESSQSVIVADDRVSVSRYAVGRAVAPWRRFREFTLIFLLVLILYRGVSCTTIFFNRREGTILFFPWKEQFCSFHEVLLPSMEGRRTEGLRQRPQSVKRLLGLSRQKVQFNPPPTIKWVIIISYINKNRTNPTRGAIFQTSG
jgi:hypothetical protein